MNEKDLKTNSIIRYSVPILLNIGLWVDMIIATIIDSNVLLSIGIIGFGTMTYPLCSLIEKKYQLGVKWIRYTVMIVFLSVLITSAIYYFVLIR